MKFTTFCRKCREFEAIVDDGLCMDCFVMGEWSKMNRIMAVGAATAIGSLCLVLWLLS